MSALLLQNSLKWRKIEKQEANWGSFAALKASPKTQLHQSFHAGPAAVMWLHLDHFINRVERYENLSASSKIQQSMDNLAVWSCHFTTGSKQSYWCGQSAAVSIIYCSSIWWRTFWHKVVHMCMCLVVIMLRLIEVNHLLLWYLKMTFWIKCFCSVQWTDMETNPQICYIFIELKWFKTFATQGTVNKCFRV